MVISALSDAEMLYMSIRSEHSTLSKWKLVAVDEFHSRLFFISNDLSLSSSFLSNER
jgi:hypothetical protein